MVWCWSYRNSEYLLNLGLQFEMCFFSRSWQMFPHSYTTVSWRHVVYKILSYTNNEKEKNLHFPFFLEHSQVDVCIHLIARIYTRNLTKNRHFSSTWWVEVWWRCTKMSGTNVCQTSTFPTSTRDQRPEHWRRWTVCCAIHTSIQMVITRTFPWCRKITYRKWPRCSDWPWSKLKRDFDTHDSLTSGHWLYYWICWFCQACSCYQ